MSLLNADTVICENCGLEFHPKPRNKNRFCSRGCTSKFASSVLVEATCDTCGISFMARKAGAGGRYCSIKCRNRNAYLKSGTPGVRGPRIDFYKNQRYKKYGLTQSDIDSIMKSQGNGCAICGKDISAEYHIDHCHATGKVRGLLCPSHNLAIGHFNDDPKLLRRAAKYLEENR